MPRLNFREDLGENIFDNNSKFEDCECGSTTSACVNHRGESCFDKSDEEMSEMLYKENPVRTEQNLYWRGKGEQQQIINKKNALYLSVNAFSTKVLIGDTIFYVSLNGDGTAILRGHPSHAKVQPPAGQREYLHFSV